MTEKLCALSLQGPHARDVLSAAVGRDMSDLPFFGRADVTIGALPVSRETATEFGTMETDASHRVRSFHEKVTDPPALPGHPTMCLASMGIYCFSAKFLLAQNRVRN
jgi:ADP-glucose pyrophosphorylase